MKKVIISASSLFLTVILAAQENHSRAYNTGYAIGRVVGMLAIAGLLIWAGYRLVRKKK